MKYRIVLIILALVVTFSTFCQSVGINQNGGVPNSSAILDVESTSKGLLPPRMTTAERNAIINPADGLLIFNNSTGCLNYYFSGGWHVVSSLLQGSINSLDCSGAIITGTLTEGVAANNVSAEVDYTGGNGESHIGQTVNSTGVSGLTATTLSGNFAIGAGFLIYSITGTPLSSGTATFALNIGGQACPLEIAVVIPFTCGTSTVTFNYNGSTVIYGTVVSAGRCWLDRNLGANQVATSPNDADAYGDLFQWGRLDDGHQERTSGTVNTQSTGDVPGHDDFIIGFSNWQSPQNPNLWQGLNGINNVCPDGYRLPTQAEWYTERLSWSTNNAAGAFASPLKIPMAGDRDSFDGTVYDEGSTGFCWSSDVDINYAWGLYFNSGFANMNGYYKAYGMSVRCIKN